MSAVVNVLAPDQVRLSLELAAAPPNAITFPVHGKPSTKGSTRSFRHATTGRIVTVADASSLPAWTQAIAWSAHTAGVPLVPRPLGVCLVLWVFFARPASVTAKARPLMTVKPDIDKVLRAALDALTGIAYDDDSQVVSAHAIKRYGPRTETILQLWEERP